MRPDVCRHGSLRRQCEPCDLEEELDTMTRLARRLFANTKHFKDCVCVTCEDARSLLSRTTPPGEAPGEPSPKTYVSPPCPECNDDGWISVPDRTVLLGKRTERCPMGCPDEIERATRRSGEPDSPATTQTRPTCGECGSAMVPKPAGSVPRGFQCVNCRREAQPSKGTPKP